MMKAKCVWKEGFNSVIDDGRGHSLDIDLPEHQGGKDIGTSALDLTVMSLAGCIVTIFALLAKKMKINFSALSCEVNADKPQGASTITGCEALVKIKSENSEEELARCLEKTEKICPVGVIFHKAQIKVTAKLEKI